MFRWRANGAGSAGDVRGAFPTEEEKAAISRHISSTRSEMETRESALRQTISSSHIRGFSTDTNSYDAITHYSDLTDAKDKATSSFSHASGERGSLEAPLEQVRRAGHPSSGTVQDAKMQVTSIDKAKADVDQFLALLEKNVLALTTFKAGLNRKITREKEIDSQSAEMASGELLPLHKADTDILLAKTIPPQELIHTDFFENISREGKVDPFDIAISRISDMNEKNIDGNRAIFYTAKYMFEHGIKVFIERGAITEDTFLKLLELENMHDQLKLFIRLVGSNGYQEVFTGIETCDYLTEIHLRDMSLTPETVASLTDSLSKNRSIRHVDISKNHLGEQGSVGVGNLLSRNHNIKNMILSSSHLSDEAGISRVQPIADGLAKNNGLAELRLDDSKIPYYGGIAIARAIKANQHLQKLDLSNNDITDVGILHIFQDLAENLRILELSLRNNKITDAGASAIAEWVEDNYSVIAIDISENKITDEGFDEIREALEANQTLLRFNCDNESVRSLVTTHRESFSRNLEELQSGDLNLDERPGQILFVLFKQIISGIDPELTKSRAVEAIGKIKELTGTHNLADYDDKFSVELLASLDEYDNFQ